MVYVSYLLFLVLTKRAGLIKLIKEWKAWFSVIIGISPILIFFLINLITKGNVFPALLGGGYVKEVSQEFAFGTLNFIRSYLNPFSLHPSGNFFNDILFLLFILGIAICVLEIFLGYGFISKNKKFRGHLLMILMFVVFYSFFIFYIKGAEDRWLFPLSITFVMFSAYGLDYVYEFIKKYNKNFALILVLAILAFGAYNEIKFADLLINEKKETYLQMKQGFEWLRDNSDKNSIVMGGGIEPYIIYYAEMAYVGFPTNESDIEDINAEYSVIHAFNKHPDYVQSYLQSNQDKWQPINAFFFDEEKKQAAFVIYKRI